VKHEGRDPCSETGAFGMLGGGYTPHPMHECQKKGLAKRAIRKRMKTKSLFFMRKRGAIHKCVKRKNGDGGGYRGVNPKMGIVDRCTAVFVRAERRRWSKILIGKHIEG